MPLQPLARPQARISMQPAVCTQRWTSYVHALHRQPAHAADPAQATQPFAKDSRSVSGLQLVGSGAAGAGLDLESGSSFGATVASVAADPRSTVVAAGAPDGATETGDGGVSEAAPSGGLAEPSG